jgi:hydroxymethylpyrimidine/phosphomethylpyrimidine kinase
MTPESGHARPRALTIAGSDSGGGAGIQADLKTFQAFGVYGLSAVTAVTAQNTLAVASIHAVPAEVVAQQIDAVATDFGVDAVKTGMLGTREVVEVVVRKVRQWQLADRLVIDPVMTATTGQRLLDEAAVRLLVEELVPLAAVLTPNIPEAEVLLGGALQSDRDYRSALPRLLALGPRAVVLKGGHRQGDAVDFFYDGGEIVELTGLRLPGKHTHGTGCTFSAAMAAALALGQSPEEAARLAKRYVAGAIEHAPGLGKGNGPLAHDWNLLRDGVPL